MEYRVTWTIELDADSPEDAARRALEIQRDRDSWATHFDVRDAANRVQEVDLGCGAESLKRKENQGMAREFIVWIHVEECETDGDDYEVISEAGEPREAGRFMTEELASAHVEYLLEHAAAIANRET